MSKTITRPHRTQLAGWSVRSCRRPRHCRRHARLTAQEQHAGAVIATGEQHVTYERNAAGSGNLTEADGSLYAPVIFPRMGRSIWSLSVYVRDFVTPGCHLQDLRKARSRTPR